MRVFINSDQQEEEEEEEEEPWQWFSNNGRMFPVHTALTLRCPAKTEEHGETVQAYYKLASNIG